MRHGMASVMLLCAFDVPRLRRPGRGTSASLRAAQAAPFEPFRRDLPIPPELRPTRRTRTADIYDLTPRSGVAEILPGFQTPVYGYDGVFPGPTIRARKGRRAIVRQHNSLGTETVVH